MADRQRLQILCVCLKASYQLMYVYAPSILPTSHRNQGMAIGNGISKLVGLSAAFIIVTIISVW
eukprot:757836-Hanusia_phi.AAC.2